MPAVVRQHCCAYRFSLDGRRPRGVLHSIERPQQVLGETDDQGKPFNIDLKRAFDILKASGYRGYCSMEFDASGEPYAPTAKLIEQSILYLS